MARRSWYGNMIIILVLLLLGAFLALPLVYAVTYSLKPLEEVFVFPPALWVKRPTLWNYKSLIYLSSNMGVPLTRYLFNSVFISAAVTAGHIIVASMAAYPLAKYKMKLSWLFNVVVGALLFNTTIMALPQYLILSRLRVINTYFVYILPILPMPIGLFLMKQFMERLPFAMIEAAKIDGAGEMGLLFRIVMPVVKPAWLTLCVFVFAAAWNQQPMSMVFDENLKLINMVIIQIASGGLARAGAVMAAGVIIMIPPVAVFMVTQNSVIQTMQASGIKE